MKKSLLTGVPSLAALFFSSHAFAVHYHLSDNGMCNQSSKGVNVSYSVPTGMVGNGFKQTGGDIPNSTLGKHYLAPGKCATLSFTMDVTEMHPISQPVVFYAGSANCSAQFHKSSHTISDFACDDGDGLHLTHHGNSEHFQIYINNK